MHWKRNIMYLWLLLAILAEHSVFTTAHVNKSDTLDPAVYHYARSYGCKKYAKYPLGITIECLVPVLDETLDLHNYTGRTDTLKIFCDKRQYLPSKISDGIFQPIGAALSNIEIYDCHLTRISKHAFVGLSGLTRLWIKGRSKSEMERNCSEITDASNATKSSHNEFASPTSASMCGYDVLVLPYGVFSYLHNLNSLELTAMRLNSSAWQAVKTLSKLRHLDLSYNVLETIPTSVSNFNTIKSLSLKNNCIQLMLKGTFECLNLLRDLDLSNNNIRMIESGAFQGLSKLYKLYLQENSIEVVEMYTFTELRQLSTLNLSENNIRKLKMDGLKNLKVLDLSVNNISSVEVEIFKELVKVETLDMSKNGIKTVETGIFKYLSQLRRLDLAENDLTSIPHQALSHLTSLSILNLSYNFIDSLPRFPSSLTSLDIRNNNIAELDNSSFAELPYLVSLDLSHNNIHECTQYNIPYTVKEWNLSSNNLSVASLNMTSELRLADLRNNKLESLAIEGLMKSRGASKPAVIYLAGNGYPFRCICNLDMLRNETTFTYNSCNVVQYHIWNFASINCLSDNKPGITKITAATFICNTSCHGNCTCYHWIYRQSPVNIVDCLNAGLTSVPAEISVSSTILDLSGNMFHSLGPENFDGLSQLVELYLNASNITEVKDDTFKNLSHLTKLDISKNNICRLNAGLFKGLIRIFVIDLSFNMIKVIEENTFKSLDRLKYLNLAGNQLETISNSDIDILNKLASLTLSDNPWSCNCTFLDMFVPLTRKSSIQDQNDIICFTSNKTEYHLVNIFLPDFCPDSDNRKLKQKSATEITLYIFAGVTVFCIICFALLHRNRKSLKLWFFIKCGWKSISTETEDWDRLYDAFVSYSNADEAFVTDELMPRLEEPREGRLGYSPCVHFRDFPVGGHIPETILGAVNSSRRVIMVLSDNFLSSEWCNYEFQAAHHQLLTEWKNRIIMVLLHDLNSNLLDRQLKLYLSTRTYVRLEDPLVWDKIEYAMPERKQPNEENLNADNTNDQEDNMQAEGDEHKSDDEQLVD